MPFSQVLEGARHVAPDLPDPSDSIVSRVFTKMVDLITEYRLFRVPVLNWAVLLVYSVNLFKLCFRYKNFHASTPLGTTLVTNLLLYGLADTLAQSLRSAAAFSHSPEVVDAPQPALFRYIIEKGRPRRVILDEVDDDLVELGLALPQPVGPADTPATHPEVFNFRRLALFSSWGFIVSFFQSPWYAFLNNTYGDGPKLISILQRVLVDQLFYSPISLACFLSYVTIVIEIGDKEAVKRKLMSAYVPTLAANYSLWPGAQFVNFMFIPPHLQIPFSSIISVFWNTYLSLKNPT